MPTSICPTVDELAAMLGGTLNEDRLDAVMEHVDQCDECQAKVENIQTIDPLEQQLADLNGRKLPSSDGSSRSGSGSSSAKVIELPTEIGPYRLYRTIAVGGMGTVYEARHRRLGRPFAVKLLHFGSRMSRMEAEMVRSEWRTHGRLVHPNIVSATDAGIADGQPYLVTERIEGIDLSTLVKRHGPLKPADACEIIRQAAEGLEYAHEQQVVHGDVKPSNLMLNQRGVVKLLDLGTARPLDHTTLGRRKSGTTHGTLAYMAPEQLWRELNSEDQLKRDHRADIYSLGCSLYCLLTGQPPFSGAGEKSNQELIEAHRSASPTPLSEAVPNRDSIDPELQQVVDRMLEKNANDRFDSMRQLADQLSPLCQANHVHALAQQYSESADTDDHASEFIDASRGLTTLLTIGSPKRPWLLPAVASTILLVAVSAWFLMRQTDQPPSNVSLASSTPPMQQPAQRIPEQQIFTARTSLGEDITNAEGPFWVPSPRTGTLDGLALQPTKFDGIDLWQLETIAPRGRVRCLRWSADGTQLGVVSADGHIRIFSWRNKQLTLARLIAHRDHRFTSVEFHRDRDTLLATTYENLLEIDSDSGNIVDRVAITGVRGMQWVGGIDKVSVHSVAGVGVFDPETLQQIAMLAGDFRRLCWSRDGERCAYTLKDSIWIRRFTDDDFHEKSVGRRRITSTPRTIEFTPSKQLLALGYDDRFEILNRRSDTPSVSVSTRQRVDSIAFGGNDDDLVLGALHGVYQLKSTRLDGPSHRHQFWARTRVAWNPTEDCIAVGQRGTVRVVDNKLKTIASVGSTKSIRGVVATAPGQFTFVIRSGKLVSTDEKGKILGWSTFIPEGTGTFSRATDSVWPGFVTVFRAYDQWGLVDLPAPNATPKSAVDTRVERSLVRETFSSAESVQRWNIAHQEWEKFFAPKRRVKNAAVAPDQKRVAILSGHRDLNLIDYQTKQILLQRDLKDLEYQNSYHWIDNDTLLVAGAAHMNGRHVGRYRIDTDRWDWMVKEPLDCAAAEVFIRDDESFLQAGTVHDLRRLSDGHSLRTIDVSGDYGRRHGRLKFDAESGHYFSFGYDHGPSDDSNSSDGIICWDAETQTPRWFLVDMGEEEVITMSPAGQIISATKDAAKHLIWIVKYDDRIDLHTQSEFRKRANPPMH